MFPDSDVWMTVTMKVTTETLPETCGTTWTKTVVYDDQGKPESASIRADNVTTTRLDTPVERIPISVDNFEAIQKESNKVLVLRTCAFNMTSYWQTFDRAF